MCIIVMSIVVLILIDLAHSLLAFFLNSFTFFYPEIFHNHINEKGKIKQAAGKSKVPPEQQQSQYSFVLVIIIWMLEHTATVRFVRDKKTDIETKHPVNFKV